MRVFRVSACAAMRTRSRRQPFSPPLSDSSFRARAKRRFEVVTSPAAAGRGRAFNPGALPIPTRNGMSRLSARHDKSGNVRIITTWSKFPLAILATSIAMRCTDLRKPRSKPTPQPTIEAKAKHSRRRIWSPPRLGTLHEHDHGMKADEFRRRSRGMTVSVQKEMSDDALRRIVELPS